MAVSEPGPGLPRFIGVDYVDDQPIDHYDNDTQTTVPVAPWMRRVEQDAPQYFKKASRNFQNDEKCFRETLPMLMARFHHNHSTGLHTLQLEISCEVWPDGRPRGGSWKYAYDREDFLVLNMETPAWEACVPQAEFLKKKLCSLWDLPHPQRGKDYLEYTCVDYLRKFLRYGNETLLRTEPPTVRVARKKGYDGRETLFCEVYGFYPKEINVTWLKDGEVRKQDTLTVGVVPNSDGTYYTSLSIGVDPKNIDHYWCQVEHDSLPEPLERVLEDPASNWGPVLGILVGILGAVILVITVISCMRGRGQPSDSRSSGEGGQPSDSRSS
ncbi:UNVERIFIED_CONTAM: hypothetical protein K2H54_065444, partial [Gekko kuhli]